VLLVQGRLAESADNALEGLAEARRYGYLRTIGIGLASTAAEALLGLGEWSRSEEVLERTLRDSGDPMSEAVHVVCAQLALVRGRLEVASEHLKVGAQYRDKPYAKAWYGLVEAELALWEGRSDDAVAVIDWVLHDPEPSDVWYWEPYVCALGLRALVELVRASTLRRDDAAVADARHRGHELLERARRSVARAAAVSPEAHGWTAVAEAEHTRVEGSPSPERWQNAMAIWAQHERPYLAAYCRWRLAEALLAAGAPRIDAAVPAREAHRVAQRLGATLLVRELEQLAQRARLDLAGADASALPDEQNTLGLTPREREVLQLLGRGYTNREIASELTITVKTASVHVSHILRKLDVASRLEAAEIAHRLTPPPPAPPEQ
jgi:DNA-binding CsgD family transcriptional regulator